MGQITGSDSVITKSDLERELANFYSKIQPYLNINDFNALTNKPLKGNTTIASILADAPETPVKLLNIANKIDKANIYSTTEQVVGQWTDGRPLYQKTINFGSLPNAASKSVAHGISNLRRIVDLHGYTYNGTTTGAIPYAPSTSGAVHLGCYADSTNITVNTGSNLAAYTETYVTIQYTKTTDSAMPIGTDTDYSTTEKLIGSWTDGRLVYQRSFVSNFGTVSNTSWTNITLSSTGGVMIGCDGSISGKPFPLYEFNTDGTVCAQARITCNSTNGIALLGIGSTLSSLSYRITVRYAR